MRHLIENENLLVDEFEINVFTLLLSQNLIFAVKDKDTIYTLKISISRIINAHPLEQSLMVGPDFPYPLRDDLLISNLLDNHRNLNLVISENPKEITPTRLTSLRDKSYINDNYIPGMIRVLNFQNIEENDIEYIHHWIFSERYKTIEIDWNNPYFYETIKAIVDSLDATLVDSPSRLSKIVFYNKDEMKQVHIDSFSYFKKKLKEYRCYDNIKFIDYSNRTFFSV